MSEGKKEILLGDCLELMKHIPNGSIDMILCDLPYGTTACKWDTIIPFDKLWEQYKRVIKLNGCIALMCGEPFTSQLINSNLPMFRYKWIWDKKFAGNFVTANKRPLNTFEEIVVFYNNQPTYNPQKTKRDKPITSGKRCHPRNRTGTEENLTYEAERKTYDDKHPTTIISIPRKIGKGTNHPTEKPTELMEYLIQTYTNENDLVLDNTAGSGTTAIACLNTNRQFIVMEKEQKYYDIILKRVGDFNKNFEPQTLFNAPNEALQQADVISSFACFDEDNECTEQCGLCKHVVNGLKQANGL